jgi:AcrR family transcriptional regulator
VFGICTVDSSSSSSNVRGRPRDPRVARAILDSAHALLVKGGLEALTIEAVAAEAGVARTTVYRRWKGADELLAAALDDVVAQLMPPANSADTRADLTAIVEATIGVLTSPKHGGVVRALLSEIARDAKPVRRLRRRLVEARMEELQEVLARGVARGDLRADVDAVTAADLLLGPVYYRLVIAGRRPDAAFVTRVVDAYLGSAGKPRDGGAGGRAGATVGSS